MGAYEDLTGKTFGRWLVLKRVPNHKTRTAWLCQCQCGVQKEVLSCHLKSGRSQSCGCLHKELNSQRYLRNLIGQRFGMLVVKERDMTPSCRTRWICQCDCGNVKSIEGIHLTQGKITSCGCDNLSNGEREIKTILEQLKINFKQEFSFTDLYRKENYLLRFDFAIFDNQNNLIKLVEFNGKQHYDIVQNWNTEEQLKDLQERDLMKQEYCKQHNIPLVIIPYTKLGHITKEDLGL